MQQAWNLLELNLHQKLSQKITLSATSFCHWSCPTYTQFMNNLCLCQFKIRFCFSGNFSIFENLIKWVLSLAEPFSSDHVIFSTIILNVINVVQKNVCFILKLLLFLLAITTATWISFRYCLYLITVIHNWLDNSQWRG